MMKPDQERMHTVLTDTISLLCRNGLNYEKELKVQGVIGVTVDDKEVFIVHINETFDLRTDSTELETTSPTQNESMLAMRPTKMMTRRLNQRNYLTEYSRTTSSAQRSSRMARMKARHMYRMPSVSPASVSRPFPVGEKSPSCVTSSPVLENPLLPYVIPGMQDGGQGSSDRTAGQDSPERDIDETRANDENRSQTIVVKDDESEEHERDAKVMPMKEDDDDDDEENIQHYSSITSSLQDSNDAGRSEGETEQGDTMIHEQCIKVESDSFNVEAAAASACNEFSAFGLASSLPASSSFLPDSRDSHSFSVDLKTECYERRKSTGLLSMEGSHEGLPLPLHSKQLMSAMSPGQVRSSHFGLIQFYDELVLKVGDVKSGFWF